MSPRTPSGPILAALLLLVAMLVAGAPAVAQTESYTFTLGLTGGIGGSLDADDPEPGLGEPALQVVAAMVTGERTLVAVRAGRIDLEGDTGFERFAKADLEYVNVAGEYHFPQSFYVYGVYFGIGYYRLAGDLRTGGSDREQDVGLVLGMTGDFDITRHLSLIGEISGHYAFLDDANLYTMASVGLAAHF